VFTEFDDVIRLLSGVLVVESLFGLDEKSGEMGLISLLFTSTTLTAGVFGELSSCFELDKDDEDEANAADDEFVVFFCFFFDTLLIDSAPREARLLQGELFFDPFSFFPPGISSSLFVVTKVGPSLLLLGDTVDAAVSLLSLLLPLLLKSLSLFVVFGICCLVLDIQLNWFSC